MSNTGLTTQQLFNSTAAAILADLEVKFSAVMNQDLAGKGDQGPALMNMVIGWYDRAVQQVGAGAASITVPVSGGASSGLAGFGAQPTGALAAAPFGAAPVQGGLGGMAQQAVTPNPFGAPVGFGVPFGGGPAAPQAGNLPKGTAASLQACGRCRVPTSQSPEGAVCGVAHNKNECKGVVLYCTAPATKQGASGYWTCSAHVKRPSPDLTGRGAKKSGGTGGAVISPGQLTGLGRPTGVPPGFGANPAMAGNIANLMGQNPQQIVPFGQQPFGQAPPFGQQQTVANQGLSTQLMQSVHGQVSQMPQQQPGLPGAFNVNNMLQGGAPTSLPVGQGFNPMIAGIPQTPGFGGQQVAPSVINTGGGFEEDGDDEDEDESSNGEDTDRPMPQSDPNAVNAALQAAGFQQQQFGGQAVPMQQPFQPIQFGQQPAQSPFQQTPQPVQFGQAPSNPLQHVVQQAIQPQQVPIAVPPQATPQPFPTQTGPNPLAQAMLQQATQPLPVPQAAPAQTPQPAAPAQPPASTTLADALKAATTAAPVAN